MTILAVRLPAAAGRKVTRMAHLLPGETGAWRQSAAAISKSFGWAPDSVTDDIASGSTPLFVTV
jgi:hypothetical protein